MSSILTKSYIKCIDWVCKFVMHFRRFETEKVFFLCILSEICLNWRSAFFRAAYFCLYWEDTYWDQSLYLQNYLLLLLKSFYLWYLSWYNILHFAIYQLRIYEPYKFLTTENVRNRIKFINLIGGRNNLCVRRFVVYYILKMKQYQIHE